LKDHIDKLEHPDSEAHLLLSKPSSKSNDKTKESDNSDDNSNSRDKQGGKKVLLREKSVLAEKLRRSRQQEHAPYSRK
jgi:hypothetical protein